MKKTGYGLALLLSFAELCLPAKAQTTSTTEANNAEPVIVGVSHLPPFAIATPTESGQDWDGIGVHLWREVAEELEIPYEWKEIEPGTAINQVENGRVDIAITAAATAQAEQRVDFTQSYYVSSIGIAQTGKRSFIDNAKAVLSPRFLWTALWISLLLVVVGFVVWLFERHSKEENFDNSLIGGLWDSLWWSAVTMTSLGYGDKVPSTLGGRFIALLWMIIAMGVAATLTATITSAFADNSGSLTQVAALKQLKVGSIEGSRAASALQAQQISFQPIGAPEEGLTAITEDRIDVFVDDNALLKYLNRNSLQRQLIVESTGLQARRYAFALPEEDPRLEAISRQVIQEQSDADWPSLVERFLPED